MDKFLVSELTKMCKKYDINTTKNGKSLRKIELMEILHNKMTKKISFSNEVEIMEHPQNNNNRFDRLMIRKDMCISITENSKQRQIEDVLGIPIGNFHDIFDHELIKTATNKCKILNDDEETIFQLYNKLRPYFGDLTWWFLSNDIRKHKLLTMIT
tara:strand:+ start:1243 stop:1710 length:468 start_codon:yes stop_codon:yes gene_type:complete